MSVFFPYQDGEIRSQEVGDQDGGDDNCEPDVGAHGKEVVALGPDVEDGGSTPLTAQATHQQTNQDENLKNEKKEEIPAMLQENGHCFFYHYASCLIFVYFRFYT